MRFPQSFIDDLKRQADIVRVISDYVTLKKKGANWMACCPFHQEKTPSFSVSPSKGIFYCFGCGQKGGVINFVMEAERVSFPEAVRIVAGKAGVPLPELVEDKRFEARRQEADEVVQLNAWALEFWERHLAEGDAEARAAREYVSGRGISDETRQTFRLGYAPNSWDALGSHLRSRGASPGQIERSGLVVRKEAGGFYDRFRGRLIFPVLDAQGRPVAFGARAMRPGDEPKYLNSPETAAYTKGRHLFGLHLSRDEIRRKKFAILVEGYLDLITPFQFGVRNAVASLGTALTPEQAKLLGRFARKVVVNYDGDRAGVAAAKRAIEVLLAEDFEIKVLVLPGGADPDEFVRAHGPEEYNRRRGQSIPHIQFVLEEALRERNLRAPAQKAEAVEEVLPYVRAVRHPIQRREYFDIVMDSLRVEEAALRQELWKAVNARAEQANANNVKQIVAKAVTAQPTLAEWRLLQELVHEPEVRHNLLPIIEEADYETLPTETIFRALKRIEEEGLEVTSSTLFEYTKGDPSVADLVPLLLISEPQHFIEGEPDFHTPESCLATLRVEKIDRRIRELAAEITKAHIAGDHALISQLAMEDVELKKLRRALLPRTAGVIPGGPSSS